ncbi:MAG: hypothetical protein IKY62_04830 [Clostridia bacterium]|nr:hypothetical protein [Clostridia bacterium]
MKRILSLILSLALLFTFAACGNKEEEAKKQQEKIGIDVEYYAKLGKIPEFKYKLGDNGETAAKEVEKSLEDSTDHHDGYCNVYEGDKKTTVDVSGASFEYDNKTKKIERIICFNTSYEFKLDTLVIEIQKAMTSYGHNADPRAITEDEASLLFTTSDSTMLEYKFEGVNVAFAFYDNALFATMIYNT